MKRHTNPNIPIVITFILFVALLLLFFAFTAQAEMKSRSNVNVDITESNTWTNIKSLSGPVHLPKELKKPLIKNMSIGEIGYNLPTAMLVDEDNQCYLQGKCDNEINREKDMKYGWIKIEKKKDGYYVYVVRCGKTLWIPDYIPYKKDKLERGDLVPVKGIVIIKAE